MLSLPRLAKVAHQRFVGVAADFGVFDFPKIEQDAPAVALESGETGHLQIGVDLRAIVHDLQRFAVQSGPLIQAQPFGIHVGKQAAEGAADQLLKRQLFQLRQGGVAVAEDPVHRPAFLVEHHLNVREGEGHGIKTAVMFPVRLLRFRDAVPGEAADQALLRLLKLGDDLFFLPDGVDQGLTVVEIDVVGDVVNGHGGHQTAPVNLDKSVAKSFLQLADLHPRLIYLAAGNVDLGGSFDHHDIENGADIQHQLFPVG